MRAPLPPDRLQELRDRIRAMEGLKDRGPLEAGRSTGFEALDRLLVGRGLRAGSLVEWRNTADGSGAMTLALAVSGHLLSVQGTLVVVDDGGFYPSAAAGLGVPLERTVVVRTDDPDGGLWTWEQALRAPGVTVTLGRLEKVPDRVARRLQLAVEAGGGFGFLIRPHDRTAATWAGTRIEVAGVAGSGDGVGWRLRVRVTRGQAAGREASADVELGHEACPVPVAAELARPVAKRRTKARGTRPPAGGVRPSPG